MAQVLIKMVLLLFQHWLLLLLKLKRNFLLCLPQKELLMTRMSIYNCLIRQNVILVWFTTNAHKTTTFIMQPITAISVISKQDDIAELANKLNDLNNNNNHKAAPLLMLKMLNMSFKLNMIVQAVNIAAIMLMLFPFLDFASKAALSKSVINIS